MSEKFWNERAEWSIATFGPVDERGPMGPVLHLKEEVDEALEHLNNSPYDKSKFVEELVDCLFLIEDAAMRSGLSYNDFYHAAFAKLQKNKKRVWNKRISNEPVKHVKGIED